jgi:predicted DCC family thiol-disulfide oxidoreductase YuxK
MSSLADPLGHGAERIGGFTVLYDAGCPICRTAHRWLASRAQLVPLEFVPAASPVAGRRFPELDPARTLRDLTVVADTGEVYTGDAAWLACLWALADYRSVADRLARPDLLPTARRIIGLAAAVRERTRTPDYRGLCADDHPR